SPRDLLCEKLPPPPMIDYYQLEERLPLILAMGYFVELPNPISSPTTALHINRLVTMAQALGSQDQLAVHTRLTPQDLEMAYLVGATRVHAFGNGSLLAHEKRRKTPAE